MLDSLVLSCQFGFLFVEVILLLNTAVEELAEVGQVVNHVNQVEKEINFLFITQFVSVLCWGKRTNCPQNLLDVWVNAFRIGISFIEVDNKESDHLCPQLLIVGAVIFGKLVDHQHKVGGVFLILGVVLFYVNEDCLDQS